MATSAETIPVEAFYKIASLQQAYAAEHMVATALFQMLLDLGVTPTAESMNDAYQRAMASMARA